MKSKVAAMHKKKHTWISTTQAASLMGCSTSYLRKNRDALGIQTRALNPNARRVAYLWDEAGILKHIENAVTEENRLSRLGVA